VPGFPSPMRVSRKQIGQAPACVVWVTATGRTHFWAIGRSLITVISNAVIDSICLVPFPSSEVQFAH
jgi:hypothetical protein